MRVTDKGQVTIPKGLRDAAGFGPGTEVDFVLDGDGALRLMRKPGSPSRGARLVQRMAGRASGGLSTEQIMAMTRGWGEE